MRRPLCILVLSLSVVCACYGQDTYILRFEEFGENLGYSGSYKHLLRVYVDGTQVYWDDVSSGQDSGPQVIDVSSEVTNPNKPEVVFQLYCNSSVTDFPVQISVSEIELTRSGELVDIGGFRYSEGPSSNNYQGSKVSSSLRLYLAKGQGVSSGSYAQYTSGYPRRVLTFCEITTLPNNWPLENRHIFKVLVDGQQVYSLDVGADKSAGCVAFDLSDTDFDPETGDLVVRLFKILLAVIMTGMSMMMC